MAEQRAERIPLPWSRSCYVCGQDNPQGLRARCFKVGDTVELSLTTRREHSGWNDVIHGGFIATVLDEVMTWAAIVGSERPCFAAEFSIRMVEPLAPEIRCIAAARMTGARRRIVDTEAWLRDDEGRTYAKATGRYMPVPGSRMRHLRDDFVTSEECLDLAHIFGL
ncbi:MAG: PaaI family thioesterase [Candidatus Krumholzibacteriia bacterium]